MDRNGGYAASGSTFYESSAAEEVVQIKATAGLLHGLHICNYNASARYVYLFDNASASSGTALLPPIPLQALGAVGSMVEVYLPVAIPFTAGLRVASSSTGATFTASTTSDFRMTVLYK
jgi:hypothetical protein